MLGTRTMGQTALGQMATKRPEGLRVSEKESHVAVALRMLDTLVCELANAIDILEERLSTVLNDNAPMAKDPNIVTEDQYFVALAAAINIRNTQLVVLNSRVNRIVERLEL